MYLRYILLVINGSSSLGLAYMCNSSWYSFAHTFTEIECNIQNGEHNERPFFPCLAFLLRLAVFRSVSCWTSVTTDAHLYDSLELDDDAEVLVMF